MALDQSKAFESETGFQAVDGNTLGPLFTGGPAAPLPGGLAMPERSFYVQVPGTGNIAIWQKYGPANTDWSLYNIQNTIFQNTGWKSNNDSARAAIEESAVIQLFGAGTDADPNASSGTITLTRDMFYANLTLSGTAILNTAGYRIFVRGTCTISGSAVIRRNGNNGTNATNQTGQAGGAALPGVNVGGGQAGGAGVNSNQDAADVAAFGIGYGSNGGTGGNGGGNTPAALGGTVTYAPEHIVNLQHLIGLVFKVGGGGGAGGSGGAPSVLATAGGGGGGGSGGGVVFIMAKTFVNTSTSGVEAKGGNGGTGGAARTGNSGGGGGGAGGGGGFIYIVGLDVTLGTISVAGGTGGTGGARTGTGIVGQNGGNGTTGHTAVYTARSNTWAVT